tara:strand:+ start:4213 stop:4359 length:147 start_codon:yes stop_codon:yes gene_type:complete
MNGSLVEHFTTDKDGRFHFKHGDFAVSKETEIRLIGKFNDVDFDLLLE